MLKGPCLIRDSYNTEPDYKGNCIYILGRNGMLKMHTCTSHYTTMLDVYKRKHRTYRVKNGLQY